MKQFRIYLWIALWAIGASFAQAQNNPDSSTVHGLRELGSRGMASGVESTNHSGIPVSNVAELNTAADDLKAVITAAGVTDFKVYDYASYPFLTFLGKEADGDAMMKAMEEKIAAITPAVPYYLLIGKIIDEQGKVSFKVILKMPVKASKSSYRDSIITNRNRKLTGQWDDLTKNNLDYIVKSALQESESEMSKHNREAKKGEFGTKAVLLYLKSIAEKVKNNDFDLPEGLWYNPAGYPFFVKSSLEIIPMDQVLFGLFPNEVIYGGYFDGDNTLYIAYFNENDKFCGYLESINGKWGTKWYQDTYNYNQHQIGEEVKVWRYNLKPQVCEGKQIPTKYLWVAFPKASLTNPLPYIKQLSDLAVKGKDAQGKDKTFGYIGDYLTGEKIIKPSEITDCSYLNDEGSKIMSKMKEYNWQTDDNDVRLLQLCKLAAYLKKNEPKLSFNFYNNLFQKKPTEFTAAVIEEALSKLYLSDEAYKENTNKWTNAYLERATIMLRRFYANHSLSDVVNDKVKIFNSCAFFKIGGSFLELPFKNLSDQERLSIIKQMINTSKVTDVALWANGNMTSDEIILMTILTNTDANFIDKLNEKVQIASENNTWIGHILKYVDGIELSLFGGHVSKMLYRHNKFSTPKAKSGIGTGWFAVTENTTFIPHGPEIFRRNLSINSDGEIYIDLYNSNAGINKDILKVNIQPFEKIYIKPQVGMDYPEFGVLDENGYYEMPAILYYVIEKNKSLQLNIKVLATTGMVISLYTGTTALSAAVASETTSCAAFLVAATDLGFALGDAYVLATMDSAPDKVKDAYVRVSFMYAIGRLGVPLMAKYVSILRDQAKVWTNVTNTTTDSYKTGSYLLGIVDNVATVAIVEEIKHTFSSGLILNQNSAWEAVLLGNFENDLKYVMVEIKQIEMTLDEVIALDKMGLIEPTNGLGKGMFSARPNQKYNILSADQNTYAYYEANSRGGFYNRINAKWLDIAVEKNRIFYVASDPKKYIRRTTDNSLTGFGSEIHRLEWHHNFRFDPISKQMIPPTHPSYNTSLPKLTKEADRNIVFLYKK